MSDDHLLPRPGIDQWRNHAACKGRDTALWFDPNQQTEGLAICHTCPVQAPCAAAGNGEEGVWGGVSEGHGRGRRRSAPTGTRVNLECDECGQPFLYVTRERGPLPLVCGYRCRQDRNLRLAKLAAARRAS